MTNQPHQPNAIFSAGPSDTPLPEPGQRCRLLTRAGRVLDENCSVGERVEETCISVYHDAGGLTMLAGMNDKAMKIELI